MANTKRPYSAVRFYLPNIILGVLILIIFLVLSTAVVFRVKDIEVKGSTIYSDALIEDMVLNDKYKYNGLYDVIKSRFFPSKNVPFVEKISVRLSGNHKLVIEVREKALRGYTIDSKDRYVYFDGNIKVTQISDQLIDGLIPVEGLTIEDAAEGEYLPVQSSRRKALAVVYKNIKSRDITADRIIIDETDGTITMVSGEITVMLGNKTNLEEKLRRLSYILPKLRKKSGTLHLEDFTEENTDIVFKESN